VIIATGASYRSLPLRGWDRFAGVGILYAATEAEARDCARAPVVVLGGANSAGQAAAFLADHGCHVTLVARGPALEAKMSRYLVDRLEAHPSVEVLTGALVTELHGDRTLTGVTVTSADDGSPVRLECEKVFCFIGARPATSFLPVEVRRDDDGFVRTDRALSDVPLGPVWDLLGRDPLPFETSVPSAFAVGDVRSGSIKRVASAVGEGSAAVASVHRAVRGGVTAVR
jgi:thioredoxin reductase (NADPH)